MVRLGIAAAVLLTALAFVPDPVWAGETDSTTFRIQDYIPERYVDFLWKLQGSAVISDATSKTPPIQSDEGGLEGSNSFNETSSSQSSLTNSWRYRYETRQGFHDYSLGVTARFTHTNFEGHDSTLDSAQDVYINRYEQPEDRTSFYIPLTGESRRYLISDAFISVDGAFRYWYEEVDTRTTSSLHTEDVDGGAPGWINIYDHTRDKRSPFVSRRIDFTGEIRLGWGRVYEGRYAASALSVVEELRKSGRLQREPNRNEMLELTRRVHAYFEGHYWDRREYRAEAVRTMALFLRDAGIVADEDATTLLRLEDVLDYIPRAERKFGWQVQAGFGGHDRYHNYQSSDHTKDWVTVSRRNPDSSLLVDTVSHTYTQSFGSQKSRSFVPADHIILSLAYHRPITPRWQFDFTGASWFYLKRNVNGESVPYEPGYQFLRTVERRVVYVEAGVHYRFDARTSLAAVGSLIDTSRTDRYRYNASLETTDWKVHKRGIQLDVMADYRLAPSTTLSLDWTTYRRFESTRREDQYLEENDNSTTVTLGITHWLF